MYAKIKNRKARRPPLVHLLMLAVLAGILLGPVVPTFAQATPVPIVVNTNALFTSANSWITVFTPIMAIGIGISIAFAILTFIGYQILKAFQGGGRR